VKNKQKAAIPRSTPTSVLAAAPGTPEGGSALSWFTQAVIILALIPFVGYLVSYAFQVKYFAYFGIPYYFVSLIPDLVFYTSFIWVLMGPVICLILFLTYTLIHSPEKEVNNTRLSFYFLIALFILLIFYLWAGKTAAEIQEEFSVFVLPSSTTEVAVIHNFGDYLLAVPFHRIARKNNEDKTPALFEKKLVILKISEISGISEMSKTRLSFLSFEKVGPLKPKPEPKPIEIKPSP